MLIEHLRGLGYRVGCPSLDLEPEPVDTAPRSVRHWAAEGFQHANNIPRLT